jgi:hypothetical protein
MNDPTATNIAICEALGLDPKRIAKGGVTITLDGYKGPIIEVTYQTHHDDDLGQRLEKVLKRYRLEPLADGGLMPVKDAS